MSPPLKKMKISNDSNKKIICEKCLLEFKSYRALQNHNRSHKVLEENEEMVEEVSPSMMDMDISEPLSSVANHVDEGTYK